MSDKRRSEMLSHRTLYLLCNFVALSVCRMVSGPIEQCIWAYKRVKDSVLEIHKYNIYVTHCKYNTTSLWHTVTKKCYEKAENNAPNF